VILVTADTNAIASAANKQLHVIRSASARRT